MKIQIKLKPESTVAGLIDLLNKLARVPVKHIRFAYHKEWEFEKDMCMLAVDRCEFYESLATETKGNRVIASRISLIKLNSN